MKKIVSIVFIACVAMCATVVFTGCKTKKVAMEKVTGQKEVELTVAEKLAEEKPATRSVGIAEHIDENDAKEAAEYNARAAFQRKIETAVINTAGRMRQETTKYGWDKIQSEKAVDGGAQQGGMVSTIAQGLLNDIVVLKTSKFNMPNGIFKYYVCVEYNGDVSEMVSKIFKGIQDRIPQADKENIRQDAKEFNKYLLEQFNLLGR